MNIVEAAIVTARFIIDHFRAQHFDAQHFDPRRIGRDVISHDRPCDRLFPLAFPFSIARTFESREGRQ